MPWPLTLGIVALPPDQLARVHAERSCELASGGHVRLGLVALQPRHSVVGDAGPIGEFLLGQRLLDAQSLEPVPDVDHGVHSSHLLCVWPRLLGHIVSQKVYKSVSKVYNKGVETASGVLVHPEARPTGMEVPWPPGLYRSHSRNWRSASAMNLWTNKRG